MPEPIPGGTPPAPDPKGTPPNDPGGSGGQPDLDFTKLTDEQLSKVLEDKRLWNLPRIAELREQAKEGKKLKDAQATAEEERLKKQGEFETLSKNNEAKAKEWETKYQQSIVNNKIMQEAGRQGITRLDLVDKLIDKSNIKLDAEGNVTGITEALNTLIKDNEFLKGTTKSSLGGGSNPPGGAGDAEFTLTQIQDPVFYQKNRDAIMRAQAQGRITDDRE